MARIYLGLAFVAMALLLTNIALGFWTGDYGEAVQKWRAEKRAFDELEGDARQGRIAKDAPEIKEQRERLELAAAEWQRLNPRITTHMLLGIAASLVAILVNSISVTYFIGTSKWCREVVETYELDPAFIERSQSLKRRTFPWALAGMLLIVVLVAFGALSDPGPNNVSHLEWRTWHFLLAILGTGFMGLAFWMQQQNVGANYRIIEEILAEVRRIRTERGLQVEETPV
jgi:hypothetical protein